MKKSDKKTRRGLKIGLLVGALLLVVTESMVFAGLIAGWFKESPKLEISSEYICNAAEAEEFINLTAEEYEALVAEGKSFVVFVDQDGCATADGLRARIIEYAKKRGIKINRIMFSEMKDTSLYKYVRFYPSVALVADGKPIAWLDSDSRADAEIYDEYEALEKWLEEYLVL